MTGDIPGVGGASSRIGLAADIGILVLVSEVEAEIIDNVAGVLDDVGTLLEVSSGSLTAQNLKLG